VLMASELLDARGSRLRGCADRPPRTPRSSGRAQRTQRVNVLASPPPGSED
jgi:hypothetical protein